MKRAALGPPLRDRSRMHPLDELKALVLRHGDPGRHATAIPGLTLTRADTTTGPIGTVYRPLFCIVLQGCKVSLLGRRSFRYDAGKYLIATVDLPVTAQITEASAEAPYLALSLALDAAVISGLLLDAQDTARDAAPAPSAGMTVSALDDDLLGSALRLVRLLDRPRDIAALAPLVEREIVYRLLSGEQGAVLRQIGLADSRLSRIGRAIGWIRENYGRPLRVETLASLAHMSVSSFHRHFKAVTTMSPLQYQKRIRLQEARRLLLADGADVQSIGLAVGYESPSQFSREYRRMFGAPPGRDGLHLRTALSAERITA
jgi:AraC-like DNA-binding protein